MCVCVCMYKQENLHTNREQEKLFEISITLSTVDRNDLGQVPLLRVYEVPGGQVKVK